MSAQKELVHALEMCITAIDKLPVQIRPKLILMLMEAYDLKPKSHLHQTEGQHEIVEQPPIIASHHQGIEPVLSEPKLVAGKKTAKKKQAGKYQPVHLKELDLTGRNGVTSLAEFNSKFEDCPFEIFCVVAVYYFKKIHEIDAVTIDHIYTAFKELGRKLPQDIKNTVAKAGTRGYLITSDMRDYKLTSKGENLIEHDYGKK